MLFFQTVQPKSEDIILTRKSKVRPAELSDTVYMERKKNLMDECNKEQLPTSQTNITLDYGHFHFNSKFRFLYCAVEKVGSTFWRRMFTQIERNVVLSPYMIRPEHVMDNPKLSNDDVQDKLDDILSSYTSFVFVRDPYARLWSAYVDKFFSPNSIYWAMYGVTIVKQHRKNASDNSIRCGHDVTFEEFLKFIINLGENGGLKDPHFAPISEICSPCQVKFDLIGKIETFGNDFEFILDTLYLHDYVTAIYDSEITKADDAIYDAAQAFVSMKSEIQYCMNFTVAIEKVWRKMQLRGFISESERRPEDLAPLHQILVQALTQGYKNSSNNANIKEQKRKLMIDAYKQIPINTLEKISNIYNADFKHFGYDPKPYILFNREVFNASANDNPYE